MEVTGGPGRNTAHGAIYPAVPCNNLRKDLGPKSVEIDLLRPNPCPEYYEGEADIDACRNHRTSGGLVNVPQVWMEASSATDVSSKVQARLPAKTAKKQLRRNAQIRSATNTASKNTYEIRN